MKRVLPITGEYYHVYNRGVDKREVFLDNFDYMRFLRILDEFNQESPIYSLYLKDFNKIRKSNLEIGSLKDKKGEKLVEIIAYCLNPNHYHLILKQISDNGISEFMKRVGIGYTGYFNNRNERSGSLFQGKYKLIHVDSNEYLLYLSAYVNKNNFIHGYNVDDWKYSSVLDYLGKRKSFLCNKDPVLGQFRSASDYKDFIEANAMHLKEKKEMEKYCLE